MSVGYIEWWDDPNVDTPNVKGFNTRYYRHVGCEDGDKPWVVPQDGAPPPACPDDECARCCIVVPLRPRSMGGERPLTPEEQIREIASVLRDPAAHCERLSEYPPHMRQLEPMEHWQARALLSAGRAR